MELFRKALDNAGYYELEATPDNVRECFKDYHDNGAFYNIEAEEIDDIDVKLLAKNLVRM